MKTLLMTAICCRWLRTSTTFVVCGFAGIILSGSTVRGLTGDSAPPFSIGVEGANPDGSADSTIMIQRALDQAGQTGGIVHLPPGRYLVAGSLRIPAGVTLQGVM
ncbi:MAG TPA: glycosyl hydrolase family 28-related protein, partial [Verrucomicrobiae bacterium]|nr:glycosyl hydrolase family 28-related protein [Verrucomicrobiae bacterium]